MQWNRGDRGARGAREAIATTVLVLLNTDTLHSLANESSLTNWASVVRGWTTCYEY